MSHFTEAIFAEELTGVEAEVLREAGPPPPGLGEGAPGAGENAPGVAGEAAPEIAFEISSAEGGGASDASVEVEVPEGGADGHLVGEGGWEPGLSCGCWAGSLLTLGRQAQVLLTNAVLSLSRAPTPLLDTLRHYLPEIPFGPTIEGRAVNVVAAMVRLKPQEIRRMVSRARERGWSPCPTRRVAYPAALGQAPGEETAPAQAPDEETEPAGSEHPELRNLVRFALGAAVDGHSARSWERQVARGALAEAKLGEKWRSNDMFSKCWGWLHL